MDIDVKIQSPAAPSAGVFFVAKVSAASRRAYNSLMTESEAVQYEPKYLEGIEYFNNCDFFEAHEAWEEIWTEYRGPSRAFYQGLIQTAVALHHFGNGNIRGARKLYNSSRKYLEPYRPSHLGCDLDLLFVEMEECFAEILASAEQYPEVEIRAEFIPEIHLHV
jgi:predicted metal-dependent hydrolase